MLVPALKSEVYEVPPPKPQPRSGAVRARRPRVSPFLVLPLVGLLLLGVGAGFVALRVQVMTLGYALGDAKQELARLQQEHTRLAVALAQSRSLERVERLARTRLGMVDPAPAAVVVAAAADGALGPEPADRAVTAASPLAAFGEWLHARFSSTAEAGGREPGR